MTTDDGGPAFPEDHARDHSGMSLRDYYADGAMRSYCHPESISRILNLAGLNSVELEGRIASMSFKMADAMINERKKAQWCTKQIIGGP